MYVLHKIDVLELCNTNIVNIKIVIYNIGIKYLISRLLQKCNIRTLNVRLSEGLINKKPLKLICKLISSSAK